MAVRLLKAVEFPTAPEKVRVVPAVEGREKAPVIVEEKVIAAPAVIVEGEPVNTTGLLKRREPALLDTVELMPN